jgi:hypothetical protein
MPISNITCITSEAGDTGSFGSYIAINDKYLAVSDPFANRVCIYTRNNSDQWTRTKYILPPINSVPYRVGQGFGRDLKLEDDVLLIGAETNQYTKDVVNPEEFQFVYYSTAIFVGQYLTKLSSEAEIQTLNFSLDIAPGFAEFTVLSEGKVKRIVLPNNGEDEFGYSVALHKNLFLVGSPCCYTGGRAWLYEFDKPEKKPTKLSLLNTHMGTTVAISEQFTAVGDIGALGLSCFDDAPDLPRKILISAIESNATSVINEVGHLSLSKNILAVMRPESLEHCQTRLLKVFHFDRDAIPNLTLCREDEYLIDASIQNGFLVTVEGTDSSGIRICIESMHQ